MDEKHLSFIKIPEQIAHVNKPSLQGGAPDKARIGAVRIG
jgi:hypothetical protein